MEKASSISAPGRIKQRNGNVQWYVPVLPVHTVLLLYKNEACILDAVKGYVRSKKDLNFRVLKRSKKDFIFRVLKRSKKDRIFRDPKKIVFSGFSQRSKKYLFFRVLKMIQKRSNFPGSRISNSAVQDTVLRTTTIITKR